MSTHNCRTCLGTGLVCERCGKNRGSWDKGGRSNSRHQHCMKPEGVEGRRLYAIAVNCPDHTPTIYSCDFCPKTGEEKIPFYVNYGGSLHPSNHKFVSRDCCQVCWERVLVSLDQIESLGGGSL